MGTQFNVLGPIEVRRDDVVVTLTSTKQRLLLAKLLIHANEVVAVGALTEALWTGRPPATARDVLQTYVSQLRKTIEQGGAAAGAGTLRTVAPGYRLDVDPDAVDAARFERLAEVGCEHVRRRDATEALPVLRHAESLWRGPAFADLAGELAVTAETERLEALRLMTVEARIEAAMALGHPGEALVAELEALVQAHPFRERTWAQLMRCLYRDGRQAEALDAYQRLRRLLADELGLTPAPELEPLEHDILAHSPNLASMWPLRPDGSGLPGARHGGHATKSSSARRSSERVDELHAIDRLVQTERLVTIVGPGGVGKTHLATEVAARFAHAVVVVRLESVTDSDRRRRRACRCARGRESRRVRPTRGVDRRAPVGGTDGWFWSTTVNTCWPTPARSSPTCSTAVRKRASLPPAGPASVFPSSTCFAWRPSTSPPPTTPTVSSRVPQSNCSSSAPGAPVRGSRPLPPSGPTRRGSCNVSTVCRWPSKSPPAGCRR